MQYEESCSICDDCKHCDKDQDEKPCNTCLQWEDGYLVANGYENNKLGGK